MPVTDYDALDELCDACGIALGYHDIWGKLHQPGVAAKQSLLAAIGLPVYDDTALHRALEQVKLKGWDRVSPGVIVVVNDEFPIRMTLTLSSIQIEKSVSWKIIEESGRTQQGNWTLKKTQAIAEAIVGGIPLKRFEVELAKPSSNGYHQLIITANKDEARTSLIVTPKNCYLPPQLDQGGKLWGIALQLYALRSSQNWGVGDFGDLNRAVDTLAPLGVNIIGLNPLHALFTHLPEQASPYSPTSRDYLDPIYLSIEAIDEFEHCEEARRLFASKSFQLRLEALRDVKLVDYTGVWSAKLTVLEMLYQYFRSEHIANNSARAVMFRQFQAEGGADLENFGLFEALQTLLYQQDKSVGNWLSWPECYRDPSSDAVKDWADANREKIEFHQYLQWITELQLAEVQTYCASQGMTIGIYRDLAVGVTRASEQTWAVQSLYALNSSTGAPADDFNLHGQDWSLPPPRPQALIDDAYAPFIKTLSANMQHAGALRIDHVMGLMRLFWIPPNSLAEEGSYVAYPFSDLLGILALESQRNRCMVIGEDLGTVPDEFRAALQSIDVLTYRILYFEKDWQKGSFKSPSDYPRLAVASVGSHDLPTFSGFWQDTDLDLSEALELFPSPQHRDRQRSARAQDRIEIVAALRRENLVSDRKIDDEIAADDLYSKLVLPVHRFLARSNAALMLVQLEDLFGQKNQINLPGTIDQHPNWRRKLPLNIEDWLDQGNLATFSLAITRERENADR